MNLPKAFRIACLLWVLTFPVATLAQFAFSTNNGTITITGYTGPGGTVVIPEMTNGLPITTIGFNAFGGCLNLTYVVIPDSINDIEPFAFDSCANLTSVIIPNSVTNIGNDAFGFCGSLTNAVISTNISNIPNDLFTFSGLRSVTIPDSITNIGPSAFDNCTLLDNVIIPTNVLNIDTYAFCDCYAMRAITIPSNVTSLGTWAFAGCINVTNLTIANGLTSIPPWVFDFCPSLNHVEIPDSVTNIGSTAFDACYAITNITYGSGVTADVGNLRFAWVTNLNSINVSSNNPVLSSMDGVLFDKAQQVLIQYPPAKTGSYSIPDSVTSVWQTAFIYCTSLSSIAVGNCITDEQPGINYFHGCTGLTNITIVASVTNISPLTFYDCSNLKTFFVDPGNPFFSSLNGVLVDKNHTTIIRYPNDGAGNYLVPDGVTGIALAAFANCTSPTNITMPNSLTNIGIAAFYSCSGLTSVTIPEGITSIEESAFGSCINLAKVTISGSVTNIGPGAFTQCGYSLGIYFKGDSPDVNPFAFTDDPDFIMYPLPTLYYLPGTTGWSNSLASAPTKLWLPEMQLMETQFAPTNAFGFNIKWASGQTVVVEVRNDLTNPAWEPLQTNILGNDTVYFSDPASTNYSRRFYRLHSP